MVASETLRCSINYVVMNNFQTSNPFKDMTKSHVAEAPNSPPNITFDK